MAPVCAGSLHNTWLTKGLKVICGHLEGANMAVAVSCVLKYINLFLCEHIILSVGVR